MKTDFSPLSSAVTIGPAHRMTVTDVAKAAEVSRTTVSYVLSGRDGVRVPEGTRQRILDAAERLGYRRNALGGALRTGRINTIGIIAPVKLMTSPPGTPGAVYFKDLVLALSAAAFEAGLNPMFISEDPLHRISIADLTDRRVDGVILFAKVDVQRFVQESQESQVPCVTIGSEHGACQVHTNHIEGGLMATEHLLGLGHRDIGYFWSGEGSYAGISRREGYRRALRRAGVSMKPSWEISARIPEMLREVLSARVRPTAIFCYNEELAVVLLDLCRELKIRVPEELSVVGFDDTILAVTARPRLTTIRSPLMGLSQAAVEMLQSQIRGEICSSQPVLVSPSLTERDSTCPPFKPPSLAASVPIS